MYNILKNEVYAYFVNNFAKISYNLLSKVEGKEEVYYRENDLVVIVHDKEVGERIYDVVKSLKDKKEIIATDNINFKIYDYVVDKQNRVKAFYVEIFHEMGWRWNTLFVTYKLQELIAFADDMQKKGYILDESRFENERCEYISDFLSFFKISDEKDTTLKGCLIKYVHYLLSDSEDFDNFYQKIAGNNGIYKISEFPYGLSTIEMCYNYFVTGTTPKNIYEVLEKECECRRDYSAKTPYYNDHRYVMLSKSDFEAKHKIIETNDECTIYDGFIKIYHNVSSEFEQFLKRDNSRIETKIKAVSQEQIDTVIIDFEQKIIGYEFWTRETIDSHFIMDTKFKSQYEIFEFMQDMCEFITDINSLEFCAKKEKNEFDIENSLSFSEKSARFYYFEIVGIKDLFDLICNDENMLKNQITTVFFKVFLAYLEQKYGKLNDEEQFFDKTEIRYLSPVLARELINYALKKKVDYESATKEFLQFFIVLKKLLIMSMFMIQDLSITHHWFRLFLIMKQRKNMGLKSKMT